MNNSFNEQISLFTLGIITITALIAVLWHTTSGGSTGQAFYSYNQLPLYADALTNDGFFQIFGQCAVSLTQETTCTFENIETSPLQEFEAIRLRLPATTLDTFNVEKFSVVTRGNKGYPQLFDCAGAKECILRTAMLQPEGNTFSISATIAVKPIS
ncbi:hypothetical protein HY485_02680 [Candidatus Woesearchaeota archaeon]|nr:hypothetical protein [Candidatus Woesearchaeota archaeon]